MDGLRGLAALYVVVGHARWLLWEGFSDGYKLHPDHYGPVGRLLVFASAAFRFGNDAVIFFFVLSGFVVHLRYSKRLFNEGSRVDFDLWPFFLRRARRLYPPLVVAMLFTLVLDTLGQHLALPIHRGLSPLLLGDTSAFDHRPVTALRNLLFVMKPIFGSDGPLWSLNYEAYFYLLYPAVFLVARRSRLAASLGLVALSAAGFAITGPTPFLWLRDVLQLMIIWWLGALLADRYSGHFTVRYETLRWLTISVVLAPLLHLGPKLFEIVTGVGFVGLVAACLACAEDSRIIAFLARLRPLGEMSYTLYVIHFPVLVLMSGLVMKSGGGRLPEHFGWTAVGIALCTGVAWVVHFAVERPFARAPSPVRETALPG